ncbi:MAG TPA: recombinase family protein [Ktedonobacterales bacterium]|nr:recombinase family protein [Ktedonobacterales bacterium]
MRRQRFRQEAPVLNGPERAAIYARVSTIKQRGKPDEDDKLSLEDQEVGCRKLCQAKGYVVNETYVVREVSSGDTVHRPLLEDIYAAAKRGEIDLLIMYRVNRFARNDDKATYLYGRAVYEHQMRIEFVEAPPNEKLERFHMKFKSIFAEEYRDEVMKLTLEKKRERVTRRGLLMPGAWPLFGYTWDNEVKKSRYVIDEEAAAIVRRIFELAASGMTLTAICRLLNAEGVPTPSAYQRAHGRLPDSRQVSPYWWSARVSYLLHNPAYWGEHAAFRHAHKNVVEQNPATGKYESFHEIKIRPQSDPTVVPLSTEVCPPLVEKWQAEAAHQRIAANKFEAGKYGGTRKAALLRGGYVFCGYCGQQMYCRNANASHMPLYYCRSVREKREGRTGGCPHKNYYLRHLPLDQAVWQDIVAYFSDPDWLERILTREHARWAEDAGEKSGRVAELKEALAAKEAAANQLVHLAAQLTSDSMREKLSKQMNEVGAELDVLRQEYQALLQPPATEEQRRIQQQAFHHWADAAIAGLEHASIEEKRQALYWLGVEVRVWQSSGEPDYELKLTWRGLNAGRPLVLREREEEEMLPHLSRWYSRGPR